MGGGERHNTARKKDEHGGTFKDLKNKPSDGREEERWSELLMNKPAGWRAGGLAAATRPRRGRASHYLLGGEVLGGIFEPLLRKGNHFRGTTFEGKTVTCPPIKGGRSL